jgi:hypothetical protein
MARHAMPPAMQERRNCAKYAMTLNLNGALKIRSQFGFDVRTSCAKERDIKEI